MRIHIDKFGGIIPRQPEHSLDITQATIAHDVRLRRNRIEAWRELEPLFTAPGSARMVYMFGCCPLYFPSIVNIAYISPDWARMYITGNSSTPQELVLDADNNCKMSFSRMGVPAPSTALTASCTQNCSRASDARAYVYTFVNRWGEESAPSFVSNTITIDDGEPVRLTNFANPPANFNIREINLYRAVTGFREQNVQQQVFNTTFLWVATLPAGIVEYTDDLPMTEVGPVLETDKVRMPPDGLSNIISLENTIQLCGTVKNKLFFTEPFQPYNWPVQYELTLDDPVVHMGVSHGKLYITTDSFPYIVDPPHCEGGDCAQIHKLSTALPDIGCVYAHSHLATAYGYIYPSYSGLVLLKPDGSYTFLTARWFSPEDWRLLQPHTTRLGLYENYLFIITDKASFILNIDRTSFGDLEGCELTTISDRPTDLVSSNTGELLLLTNNVLYAWDRGMTYRPYYWESRELVGQDGIKSSISLGATKQNDSRGVSWSPASAKIHTMGTKFTLISPLQREAYTRSVTGEDWFRLPRIGRNLWYKIRLQGTHPVDFFSMGTSNFTLNQGQ